MKVDLNSGVANQLAVERTAKQVTSQDVLGTSPSSDRATLHTSGKAVADLVKGAMSTPAVRQDRVDSVRASLAAGTYKVDADKIAGAILSEGGN